jgi:hypothetical protein
MESLGKPVDQNKLQALKNPILTQAERIWEGLCRSKKNAYSVTCGYRFQVDIAAYQGMCTNYKFCPRDVGVPMKKCVCAVVV